MDLDTSLVVKLQYIAAGIVTALRALSPEEFTEVLQVHDYHGFKKGEVPRQLLEQVVDPVFGSHEWVQVEWVQVTTDLSSEVHYHAESTAVTVMLGETEHLPNPDRASAYLNGGWSPVTVGQELIFLPGMPHGFTVQEGGVLWFLSVQSPWIVSDQRDDYHKVA
jgi:hypothetical protein